MLKKDLYNIRFALLLLILYCTFMQLFFGTVCPLKAFANIPCPACGLTHATIYLLMGNFKKALSANPTVLLWLGTIFLFFFDRYIHPIKFKVFPYLFSIVSIITIVWYILNSII